MSRDKAILGVHIDNDVLNIVHLEQTANGLQVRNWTAEPIEAGAVEDGLIIDERALSRKIRNFVKASRLKSCKAVMSLSCSTVRLKPSEFPAQTDEQLQKQVEDQIEKYALFGGQEVVFDYCVFDETAQSSNKQTVLQAVTTRQMSDACQAVARRAKLDLVRIEPAVLPIMKLSLNKEPAESDAVSLLLVLDSASGNMSVFKDGLPQLCQNLSIGIKEASRDKDSLARLTDQMKPVLEYAHSLDSQHLVLRVAAACDSEKLRAIAAQMKQSVGEVAVEQIDYSQIAKQFGVQGADGGEVPIFALSSALTAFGASALDGQLNLISQESLAVQQTRKEMSLATAVIAAVVLLSIGLLVPLKMKMRSVEAASVEIEVKVTETVPMRKKINDLKKQMKQLKGKLSAYDVASKGLINIPWPKALEVIGDTVPDKVRIVDISTTDSGEFTLLGEALAERYVYRFAKKLRDDEFVESAKVEEIEYDDSGTTGLVDYKITGKIRLLEGDL